jgi:hypothetical protein
VVADEDPEGGGDHDQRDAGRTGVCEDAGGQHRGLGRDHREDAVEAAQGGEKQGEIHAVERRCGVAR